MSKKILKVRMTLTEEMLGTSSANPDIHREFIASKAPDAKSVEDEVAAIGIEASVEKAMTVFPRAEIDGRIVPFVYDYQIKGFFKDACASLNRVSGSASSKVKAYKKIIDGTIFVNPRKIALVLPEGGKIGSCQRPLRVQTAQGERVALANSETVPVGTTLTFEIVLLDDGSEKIVLEWLDYAKLRGLGQWRNSGKGRADFLLLD